MPRVPYTWRQPPYPPGDSDKSWIDPSIIVICEEANLDEAMIPLFNTLYEPLGKNLIASVFVHETMREKFIEKVRAGIGTVHRQVKTHEHYARALRLLDCLKSEVICLQKPDDIGFIYKMVDGSSLMSCEFNQSFFSLDHPSGVVTMHTFRNAIELGELAQTERLPFVSAALWCPKMAAAYEAALQLPISTVYINCRDVSLAPIREFYDYKQPFVIMADHYHYEVIKNMERYQMIVFPAQVLWAPQPLNEKTAEKDIQVPNSQKSKW
ncbi:uncharacterized protein Dwil_GK20103 [Drosophila willistoni]|uniref:Uncharacterized protein n=1 Tax=Drosophila willistoni TaxID=7260 RepID=B4MT72_DROWI|nr:uncharacterized protein LOC6641323 [Drosophila willistoni]EDW75311.1 uncharacterized protein Dwil_GK20103 [Drosophila willistoni]